MNVLESVQNQISPQMLSHISSLIKEDSTKTELALTGALPTVVAAMMHKAGSSKGLESLNLILGKLNDKAVSSIPELLAGGKAESLANQGSSMLATLLGADRLSSLSTALSSYSAISADSAQKILGVIGPLALGSMKQQLLKSGGIGISHIVSFMASQQEYLAQALPEELAEHLKDSAAFSKAPLSQQDEAQALKETPADPGRHLQNSESKTLQEVSSKTSEHSHKTPPEAAEQDIAGFTQSHDASQLKDVESTELSEEAVRARADTFFDSDVPVSKSLSEAQIQETSETVEALANEHFDEAQTPKRKPIIVVPADTEASESIDVSDDDFADFTSQRMRQVAENHKASTAEAQDFAQHSLEDLEKARARALKSSQSLIDSSRSGLSRILLPALLVAILIFIILNLFI